MTNSILRITTIDLTLFLSMSFIAGIAVGWLIFILLEMSRSKAYNDTYGNARNEKNIHGQEA